MGSLDKPKQGEVDSTEVLRVKEKSRNFFLNNRTLFGEEAGQDLVKRPPLAVVLDLGTDSRDFLRLSAEMDTRSFERFVDDLGGNFDVSKESLRGDSELRGAFLELRDLELDAKKRFREKKKYSDLKQKIHLKLVGFIGEANEKSGRFYNSYIKLERNRRIAVKISSLNMDVEEWRSDLKKLNEEYSQKKLTEEQYLSRLDVVNEKAVKESGDKELQKLWEDYKNDEAQLAKGEISKPQNTPSDPNENLVTDEDEASEAFVEIGDSSNIHFDLHGDGSASVVVGREKFPMEISVYKNSKTKKYVYYVFDKYADSGVVRAEGGDLLKVLDRRYLDAYISTKIGAIPEESDSPSQIPDKDLIFLCERLLGLGKDRNYRIDGENREVLDVFVSILTAKDDKYLTYYEKIRILNRFFEEENNVAAVRRDILIGKVGSVSDLLGEVA